MDIFHYHNGEAIAVGDHVLVDDCHHAIVHQILYSHSSDAAAYNCSDSGGVLLKYEKYGLGLHRLGSDETLVKYK